MQSYGIAIKTEKHENFNLWQAAELQVLLDQDTCQYCKEKRTMGARILGTSRGGRKPKCLPHQNIIDSPPWK